LVESHYKKNNRKNTKNWLLTASSVGANLARIDRNTLTPCALWLLLLWRFFANTAQYIFVCFLYYYYITQFFVKHILGRQVCVHKKKILLDTTLDLFWKIPNGKKKYYTGTTHSLVKKIWNNNGQKKKKKKNHRTTILAYFILIKALSLPLKKALRFFPLPSSNQNK
jgi:hypothetical protein